MKSVKVLIFLCVVFGGSFQLQGAKSLEELYSECGVTFSAEDVWGLRHKRKLRCHLDDFLQRGFVSETSTPQQSDEACLLRGILQDKLFEVLSEPARNSAAAEIFKTLDQAATDFECAKLQMRVEELMGELGFYFRREAFDVASKVKEIENYFLGIETEAFAKKRITELAFSKKVRLEATLTKLRQALVKTRDSVAAFVAGLQAQDSQPQASELIDLTGNEAALALAQLSPASSSEVVTFERLKRARDEASPSLDSPELRVANAGDSSDEDSDEESDYRVDSWTDLALQCASIYENARLLDVREEVLQFLKTQDLSTLPERHKLFSSFNVMFENSVSCASALSQEGLVQIYAGIRLIYAFLIGGSDNFKLKHDCLIDEYSNAMDVVSGLVESIENTNPQGYNKFKFVQKNIDELMDAGVSRSYKRTVISPKNKAVPLK